MSTGHIQSLDYLGTTASEADTTRRLVLFRLSIMAMNICFILSPGPLEHEEDSDTGNQIDGDCQRNLFRTRDGTLVGVKGEHV